MLKFYYLTRVINSADCSQFHYPKSRYSNSTQLPTCGKDGWFYPIQCKGDRITGRCFCFDNFGVRLFGQQWWNKADDMTCACSRRKAEMADKIQFFNSLHCNSVGSYESLQCDMESGQCWCADEKTGDLKSMVVPNAVMYKLPCYKSIDVGTQYLRQCESRMYAEKRILYELALHGTAGVTFGELLCDDDGSFGAYKVVDGSAFCTWRDGTKLGTYQYPGDRTALNCNCARDTRIFKNAGKKLTVSCNGGGNYKPFQEDLKYCVDDDGYRMTRPSDNPKADEDCKSYPKY